MTQIVEIGVGEEEADQLMEAGIFTDEDLIRFARRPETRRMIARRTGMSFSTLTQYLHQADMARVKGVGSRFAQLLVASGVRSLAALADCDPETLHQSLKLSNRGERLVRRLPSPAEVRRWIRSDGEVSSVLAD